MLTKIWQQRASLNLRRVHSDWFRGEVTDDDKQIMAVNAVLAVVNDADAPSELSRFKVGGANAIICDGRIGTYTKAAHHIIRGLLLLDPDPDPNSES